VRIPSAESVSAKWEKDLIGPLQIAVVSRLDEHDKRPWDYLRIAQQLVASNISFRMHILGDGPCESAMRAWLRENGLAAMVRVEGAVSAEAVSACLASSHILLSASDSEAFGLSVAEALAHACAVVSADIPGPVREMVNTRTGIRVPVGDIHGFCQAVMELQGNGGEMRRKGMAGREYIENHYPLERMIAGYCDFLTTVQRFIRPRPDWHPPSTLFATPGKALAARVAGRSRLWRVVGGLRAVQRGFIHRCFKGKTCVCL
jgi:glycosyltransferase involved in cell wall biosynthesis